MVPKLLKGNQVAELLNVSRSKAYGMIKRGEIPSLKFGKCVRVKEEDLCEFVNQCKADSTYQSKNDLFR